jgi:stage II sporulation protein D
VRALSLSAAAALVAVLAAAPGARAEEELRIALLSGQPAVAVGGEGLAIFDGDVGDVLLRAPGKARARLVARQGGLQIEAEGAATRAARHVFVEATDAVGVDKGVYFGRIEVGPDPEQAGRLLVVNRIPLETYLLGIVGSEMNPTWPLDALKAQAVAARTYAMQRRAMMRAANRPYDLASSVISQVYKGAERIRPAVIQAVKETRGEVMSHHHDLVEALFHSTCGGHTVPAQAAFGSPVEYLQRQPCEWCRPSNRYRWSLQYSRAELSRRLAPAGLVKGTLRSLEREGEDAPLRIHDGAGRRTLDPRAVRRALGFSSLFSERFSAETRGDKVSLTGLGFGHGVGMCQWGARGQALEGRTYRQILEHYYRGVAIKRLY